MMAKVRVAIVAPGGGSERGQAIVLVALMFVILLGFAGLAVDVSSAYATRRMERSIADGAALAGAQDLQQSSSTKAVGAAERLRARTDALKLLTDQFGPAAAIGCNPSSDITDCAVGATYHVAVKTPALSCQRPPPGTSTCDPAHSVQVTIDNPRFQTAFARLFGSATWDIGLTSVAGLGWASKYAVITLQPPAPRPNATDSNLCKDLNVKGNNTVLNVVVGDVGTNTSATTTNAGVIQLQSGYSINHYDDITTASCGLFTNPTWATVNGNPAGQKIGSLISDPQYPIAQFTGVTPFATQTAGAISCGNASVNFPTDAATVARLTPASGGTQTCYRPGIYQNAFIVANKDVAYLAPGAYWFQSGATVDGTLGGGLVDRAPGVVLRFPESGSTKQFVANNSNTVIMLNSGSDACASDGCRATATTDFAGTTMLTSKGLVLTVEVDRDGNCFTGVTPVWSSCSGVNQNNTLNIDAAFLVKIGGVIYGPSDNMTIVGGSSQQGYVGQIVSWSVVYTGGSILTQSYPGGSGVGTLRIDPACSAPNEPCQP